MLYRVHYTVHYSIQCKVYVLYVKDFTRRRAGFPNTNSRILAFVSLPICVCIFTPLIFTPRISHPWFLPIASAKYLHVGSGKTQKRENVCFCQALREGSKSTTNLFKKITQTNCLIEIYSHITIKKLLAFTEKGFIVSQVAQVL